MYISMLKLNIFKKYYRDSLVLYTWTDVEEELNYASFVKTFNFSRVCINNDNLIYCLQLNKFSTNDQVSPWLHDEILVLSLSKVWDTHFYLF